MLLLVAAGILVLTALPLSACMLSSRLAAVDPPADCEWAAEPVEGESGILPQQAA
jgi:hypothetical protein